jgi:hypothetical protein
MNHSQLYIKLARERKKLNKLIDKALKNGTKISETQEIIEQSRKVNHLVEIIQNELIKKEVLNNKIDYSETINKI